MVPRYSRIYFLVSERRLIPTFDSIILFGIASCVGCLDCGQKVVDVVECVPEKGVIGKQFRKDAKPIMDWLSGLDEKGVEEMERQMKSKG